MLGGRFECGGCVTEMGRRLTFVCLLRPDYEGVIFFFRLSCGQWLCLTSVSWEMMSTRAPWSRALCPLLADGGQAMCVNGAVPEGLGLYFSVSHRPVLQCDWETPSWRTVEGCVKKKSTREGNNSYPDTFLIWELPTHKPWPLRK